MADLSFHTTPTYPSRFTRFAMWLLDAALHRERTVALQQLDELSDHMLRDIGVERHELPTAQDAATRIAITDLRSRSPLSTL